MNEKVNECESEEVTFEHRHVESICQVFPAEYFRCGPFFLSGNLIKLFPDISERFPSISGRGISGRVFPMWTKVRE